jgi:hypothetical protein
MKPKRKLIKDDEELTEKYIYSFSGRISELRTGNFKKQLNKIALDTNVKIVHLEINGRLFTQSIFFKVKGSSFAIDNFKYEFINHF